MTTTICCFYVPNFHRRNILHSFALVLQEEIQKKTGYIVMRAEGVFDVDANTSIDQLSEDLNIKMPEVHNFFHFLYMHFT
jgi:hypothetical protein